MNFLEKLTKLMNDNGLNKNTLSKQSGIPYTTIDGFFKKGYDNIKMSTIKNIAAFFDVTIDFLMDDNIEFEKHEKDSNKQKLISYFETSNPKGQDLILSVAKYTSEQNIMDKATPTAINEIHIYTAPKYAATVSAGTGNYIMSDFADNIELTSPPPKGTNYIVTVSGDSMDPTYSDGDMLYIKSCPDIETGQIGIYVIDGSSYVKEKGISCLISHNKNYGDIQSGANVKCLGLVLGKVDEKDIYKASGI